jgi:hypothetical protein
VANRETLLRYFRSRHTNGDRLRLTGFRFNGYEQLRDLGHFEWEGLRRADDIRDGGWSGVAGKGALDCSAPPVRFAVLVVGET